MAEAKETVSNLINSIKNEVAVDTNLAELRLILGAMNASQLKSISPEIPLKVIFDCLNSQNETQIVKGCEVLSLVLPTLPNRVILLENHTAEALSRCLKHPHTSVKIMALDEFNRLLNSDELVIFFSKAIGIESFLSILDCLCDVETSVGTRASHFISSLRHNLKMLNIMSRPDLAEAALEKTKHSETHRLRLYEALVEIAASSEESLLLLEKMGYFRDLISTIKTDDVLANLTLLEVLTPLTRSWHGHEFLHRHEITKYLVTVLATAEGHPLKSLFYPGVVRYFGNLGQRYSQQLAKDYPEVIKTIFKMAESIEESIFITSLETIGMIAYTRSGKNFLITEQESMCACMKRVYAAVTQVPSEWKERGLVVLSNILHVEPSDVKSDFAAVVQSWFEEMNPHAFETISDMARCPFPDIKVPALGVLTEMASMKWGQTKIASNQPLLDYLLTSKEEASADCKAAKVKLLKVLADSETSPSVFAEETFNKIKAGAEGTKDNGAGVLVDMMSV